DVGDFAAREEVGEKAKLRVLTFRPVLHLLGRDARQRVTIGLVVRRGLGGGRARSRGGGGDGRRGQDLHQRAHLLTRVLLDQRADRLAVVDGRAEALVG